MAYSYRSPAELALAGLGKETISRVNTVQGNYLNNKESLYGDLFNYHISDVQKQYLSTHGVYLSPLSPGVHSHPVCKMLENHFLYVVAASYIKDMSNLVCCSMKKSKLNRLCVLLNREVDSMVLLNRIIDTKDYFRYGESAVRVSSVNDFTCFEKHKGGNFFLHDEVHHWSLDDFSSFISIAQPSSVLASVVYPPELLIGAKFSYNPVCYTFDVGKGNFIFYPDGVVSEKYEQQIDLSWLFNSNSIRVNGSCFGISLVKSIGAHHMFMITRDPIVFEKRRLFNDFDVLDISIFSCFSYRHCIDGVRFSIFKKIVGYLLALKSPDVNSAAAKMRQLSGECINLMEVSFIQDITKKIESKGLASLSNDDIFGFLVDGFVDILPTFVQKMFDGYTARKMLNAVVNAKAVSFDVELKEACSSILRNSLKGSNSSFFEDEVFCRDFAVDKCKLEKIIASCSVYGKTPHEVLFGCGAMYPSISGVRYTAEREYCVLTLDKVHNISLGIIHSVRSGKIGEKEDVHFCSYPHHGVHGSVCVDGFYLADFECGDYDRKERKRFLSGGFVLFSSFASEFSSVFVDLNCEYVLTFTFVATNDRVYRVTFSFRSSGCLEWDPCFQFQNENEDELVVDSELVCDDCEMSGDAETVVSSIVVGSIEVDLKEKMQKENVDAEEKKVMSGKREMEVVFSGENVSGLSIINNVVPEVFALNLSELDWEKADRQRGRRCFFFTKGNLNYGHDRVKYTSYRMPSFLKKLARLIKADANTALVQKFEKGSAIPFHSDDEKCYDRDHEVSCVSFGSCDLLIKPKGKDTVDSIRICSGDVYVMKKGFQRFHLHSVRDCSEGRVSITFRKQIRNCFFGHVHSFSRCLLDVSSKTSSSIGTDAGSASDDASCLCISDSDEVRMPTCNEVPIEPENMCFIESLAEASNLSINTIVGKIGDSALLDSIRADKGLTMFECSAILHANKLCVKIKSEDTFFVGFRKSGHQTKTLILNEGHFSCSKEIGYSPSTKNEEDAQKEISEFNHIEGFSVCKYFVIGSAAEGLASSFEMGATGVCSSEIATGEKLSQGMSFSNFSVDLGTIYGFAGAGKSKPIQDWIGNCDWVCLVVVPRKRLMGDWMEKVKRKKGFSVCTLENLFRKNLMSYDLIIMDEFSLFPEGYLDLLCCRIKGGKNTTKVVVMGDPLQASYYNSDDRLNLDLSARNFPHDGATKYLAYTFRCGDWINRAIDGVSCSPNNGKQNWNDPIELINEINPELPVLVPNFKSKESWIACLKAREGVSEKSIDVMTYGESQGLTFKSCQVVFDSEALHVDSGRFLVAMTRALNRPKIMLVGLSVEELRLILTDRIMRAFFLQETLKVEQLIDLNVIKRPSLYGGLKERMKWKLKNKIKEESNNEAEDRCVGDPWLKGMLNLSPPVFKQEPLYSEVEVVEPKARTHITKSEKDKSYVYVTKADIFERRKTLLDFSDVAHTKSPEWKRKVSEARESKTSCGSTEQFSGAEFKSRNVYQNKVDSFESCFPTHQMQDLATFLLAIKKRLRFSHPFVEKVEMDEAEFKAGVAYEKFKSVYLSSDLTRVVDYELLTDCEQEFKAKKLSKPMNTIAANSLRSDPDWLRDSVLLFMKSQHCTKLDNVLIDAKAGQTLACFQHEVLCYFGPWCRYLEKVLLSKLKKNFYLHSSKNFDDLNTWVKLNHGGGVCVESDYSAFDRSQDAVSLQIELMFMRDAGLPINVIEDYKHLKLTLGSKLGNFAIMRFTGEFSTFLFNSISNMAYTAMMYEDVENKRILFAGDDMCSLDDLELNRNYKNFLDDMKLVAKVFKSKLPIFCGWLMTKYGILKHPELINLRLFAANELKKILVCIDSYALEFSYAYNMGDFLYDVLDEHTMEIHHSCVREIMRYRHKIHPTVLKVLNWL